MRARLDPTLHVETIGGRFDGWSVHRKLAIVGSHPATRENAPYDDPDFEIWLFNEAPMKPQVYKRWDACLQLHRPEVYSSPNNWVNKGHWDWLQQDHGEKQIFMQEFDPRVPNSVRYPLEGVLSLVPYKYLRSSPAMALALAIFLGYQEIWLYGSELTSNTEYSYQAVNYAFWIGFAHGRGIDLHLECWQDEFSQRIYGYEGELQIDRSYHAARSAEVESAFRANKAVYDRTRERIDAAMLEGNAKKTGELSIELEKLAIITGEAFGAMIEGRRYADKPDEISRQEYERCAAKAQEEASKLQSMMDHAGGKCEYVWNAWMQSGQVAALEQFRVFLKEKLDYAYNLGVKHGEYQENIHLMLEYDKRLRAAGGVRALGKPEAYQGV